MPTVRVAGVGSFNFPEGMSQEEMKKAIDRHLGKSTFDKMPLSSVAQARQQSMQSGPAAAQYQKAMASAEQDISGRMKKVEEAAFMAPLAVAAPIAAPMGLVAGTGFMAAVGLGGGLNKLALRKATGLGNVPDSVHELAHVLGVSAAEGAAAELGGRATIGMIEGIGSLMPDLIARAAATSSRGLTSLNSYLFKLRSELSTIIPKDATASIGNAWRYTWSELRKLPTKDVSKRTLEILDQFKTGGGKKLVVDAGGLADRQPLDLLIEKKGILQAQAYGKDVPWKEAKILKDMASGLDNQIRHRLAEIPGAQNLYTKGMKLWEIARKGDVATETAAEVMKHFVPKTALGLSGLNRLADVMLQRTMSIPKSATLFTKAVEATMEGARSQATTMARKAFEMAGAKEMTDEFIKSQQVQ